MIVLSGLDFSVSPKFSNVMEIGAELRVGMSKPSADCGTAA
jgi:hypothetical protein